MGMNRDDAPKRSLPFDENDILDVPLGDLLRGERATLGKSLLDVERELKIKAAHIAAIENADLSVFATKGFVAGYVRSYARYLGMDAEWAYRRFANEAGFFGVHGQSADQAKRAKRVFGDAPKNVNPNDVMSSARVKFAPEKESWFSRLDPGALGSATVLLALIAAIGYGGWSVLTEIQRVQFVPIEEAPQTVASLDPLADATSNMQMADLPDATTPRVPGIDPIDPLYRPTALDVPVLTPRDSAIATLDPNSVGQFAAPPSLIRPEPAAPSVGFELAGAAPAAVQVTEGRVSQDLVLFAVCPAWVRVTAASGSVLYEGILNSGDTYTVPESANAPTLRSGNAGAVYFSVNGETLGPAGPGATIARDVELSVASLSESYDAATPNDDVQQFARVILDPEGDNSFNFRCP